MSQAAQHPLEGQGTRTPDIVLFHSGLGLRPGVHWWAEQLRAEGHGVHTPDLYDGEVFDRYEEGLAKMEAIGGIPALMERTQDAVTGLPPEVVYAGFSNGGASAQLLALSRPKARAAILMHAALPVEAFGMEEWPPGVPVQIHYGVDDPYRDQEAIDALVGAAERSGTLVEVWDYDTSGHLFADPDLPEFDETAASLMLQRILGFLRENA